MTLPCLANSCQVGARAFGLDQGCVDSLPGGHDGAIIANFETDPRICQPPGLGAGALEVGELLDVGFGEDGAGQCVNPWALPPRWRVCVAIVGHCSRHPLALSNS